MHFLIKHNVTCGECRPHRQPYPDTPDQRGNNCLFVKGDSRGMYFQGMVWKNNKPIICLGRLYNFKMIIWMET